MRTFSIITVTVEADKEFALNEMIVFAPLQQIKARV